MNKHLNSNYLIELKDFEGYFVNESGDVYSEHSGKLKKLKGFDRLGYKRVCLKTPYGRKFKDIHRLVLETFVSNLNNKNCVDHINRIRNDNRVENLRWATSSENARNTNKRKNNTTGTKGVWIGNKNNSYVAEYVDHIGKTHTKSFCINKLGDQAKQLAINYRLEMEQKYYTFN
jgi:hypothetical protein